MNTSLDGTWSSVWKLKVHPKIKTFVWLLYHGKILTNEERMRRRMTKVENIGFDGYISTWILWIYRIYQIYRRYIGRYFYMNIDIS